MNAVFGKLVLDRIIAKLIEGRARDKQWRVCRTQRVIIVAKYKGRNDSTTDPSDKRSFAF